MKLKEEILKELHGIYCGIDNRDGVPDWEYIEQDSYTHDVIYPAMQAYADQFKGENEAIVKHQDEIIGRLTRQNEYLVDTEEKRQEWLSKAKNDAGFDRNKSFDDVWAIVLSVYLQSLKSK